MAMWRFRGCPRCRGDVFLDRDVHSWYEQCVQCGHTSDLKSIDEFNEPTVGTEKEQAMTGMAEPRDKRVRKHVTDETKSCKRIIS